MPYALMVGELGSAFKTAGGGVSSWINETIGPKLAYYAGWTYWIVHMPYISQKPSGFMIASSWAIFQDNRISSLGTAKLQVCCLVIFLIGMFIASKGLNPLKKLATFVGTSICIGGMYSTDKFQLTLNIVTPFILIGLGLIMPIIAKKNNTTNS